MAVHPASPAYLGLDTGTSSTKAVLVDEAGNRLAEARADHPAADRAGQADPEGWWGAAVAVLREVVARRPASHRIAGVGPTGQKHALLALDARDRPLAAARLWNDVRGDARDAAGRPAGPPGTWLPKWLAFAREEAPLVGRTRRLVFAKDLVRWHLTGQWATDPTEAAVTGLLAGRRRWSPARCAAHGVPPDALPPIVASTSVAGRVTPEAARRTGLEAGIPVVGGAGDNETAALALGAVRPGTVAIVLGTSGTVLAPSGRAVRRRGLASGPAATARGRLATGVVLAAGAALDWLCDALYPAGTPRTEVLAEAAAAAGGPLFLPSLGGERSPLPDPTARGAFLELSAADGRGDLAHAVLEGVALSLGAVVDLLRRSRVPVEEVVLGGGGAADPHWARLVAGAVGVPLRVGSTRDGSARGAALLAAVAGGSDRDLESACRRWTPPGRAVPVPAAFVGRMRERAARLKSARRALASPDAATTGRQRPHGP